jgi:hypothetical protein
VGAIFVFIILLFPAGIMGTLRDKYASYRMLKLKKQIESSGDSI